MNSLESTNPEDSKAFYTFFGIEDEYWRKNVYYLNNSRKRLLHVSPALAKFVEANKNSEMRIVLVGNKYFERLRDDDCQAKVSIYGYHWR